MANVITVSNPPAETLGYIRVNTSSLTGSDETTGTSIEYYTGQGWAGIGGSNANGNLIAHPSGTFETAEDWNTDSGTYDWNTASGSEDWGPAIVTAFGAAGDISQNSDKALVAHDGSTGGGIPMLRADMSNLGTNLVNTKYNLDDIISIDESSISIGLHPNKGREIIGKRLNKITKDNKVFVKYTLIMAITTKGVLDWILYEKAGSLNKN